MTVTTYWKRSARGIYRDRAAERLDLLLAGTLRLVDVGCDGQRLLYVDLDHGEYKELRFVDHPDGFAGTASLATVSVDYVKKHYRRTPDFSVQER
ncbi:MAG: hypothetical protein AAFX44_03970 [Pseudomonadota bacterium]